MSNSPTVILGTPASGGSNAEDNPNGLAQSLQNILSSAIQMKDTLGCKVIDIGAGLIESASVVEAGGKNPAATLAQVKRNFAVLKEFASTCLSDGIGLQIDANLTYKATYSDGSNALTQNWAATAAAAGLPIVSIQNVQEIGSSEGAASYAANAAVEVNAIQTLLNCYKTSSYTLTAANLAVGDMESTPYLNGIAPSDTSSISQWFQAYNSAAETAGLPAFSFVTTDTPWDDPWFKSFSTSGWQSFIKGMSDLAISDNMSLRIDMQGLVTDATNNQFVLQVEQDAAALATFQKSAAIKIDALEFTTWQRLPTSLDQINSPTSMVNAAAEIQATYPLYLAGLITARDGIELHAPSQMIIMTGKISSLPLQVIECDVADPQVDGRSGIVLVDQTGMFTAGKQGSGTVTGSNTNVLALSGTSEDLVAELASVAIRETASGPDKIEIEIFNLAGQVYDCQINVLALLSGQSPAGFNAGSGKQGWLSSSSIINPGGVMTHETLNWDVSVPAQDANLGTTNTAPAFDKFDTVHEPLAEYGVTSSFALGGKTYVGITDVNLADSDNQIGIANQGGAANNPLRNVPLDQSGWFAQEFNAQAVVIQHLVKTTVEEFDPSSGNLESSTDYFVPNPLTVMTKGGAVVPNPFATQFFTGGTRVVLYNTGDNPSWLIGWGDQFRSATLTYDDTGSLVEEFLQGYKGFTLDYVFNPDNGALWELFQSAESPPAQVYPEPAPDFVTGPLYMTQFNNANPNWDQLDWGSSAFANTEVWASFYLTGDVGGFFVNKGEAFNYQYYLEFVNGTTLDLMNLDGTIDVNLNDLTSVTISSVTLASGLGAIDSVDAAQARGSVTLTGLMSGNCTLIGGDSSSTITGYGRDLIVAGSGATEIFTGSGNSKILLSGCDSYVSISGDDNVVTTETTGRLSVAIEGSGNDIEAINGATIVLFTTDAVLTIKGDNDTIYASERDTIAADGTTEVVYLPDRDSFVMTGEYSSAMINGDGVDIRFSASDGALTINGQNNTITCAADIILTVEGDDVLINAAAGDTINAKGSSILARFADGGRLIQSDSSAHVTIEGNCVDIQLHPGSNATVAGLDNTVHVSGSTIDEGAASQWLTIDGNLDTVNVAYGSSIAVSGSHQTVNGQGIVVSTNGTLGQVSVIGNDNRSLEGGIGLKVNVGDGTSGWIYGVFDTWSGGNDTTINMVGVMNTSYSGDRTIIGQYGFGERGISKDNASVGQYGIADTYLGGANINIWISGFACHATIGDHSIADIEGFLNTLTGADSGSLRLHGVMGTATTGSGCTIEVGGYFNTLTSGLSSSVTVTGQYNTLTVGSDSTIILSDGSGSNIINLSDGSITIGSGVSAVIKGASSVISTGIGSSVSLSGSDFVSVSANGSLSAVVVNVEKLQLTSGTLLLPESVTSGTIFLLGGGTTLDCGGIASGEARMEFVQAGARLNVDLLGAFGAPIVGFGDGNIIDATALPFSSDLAVHLSVGGGHDTLTVTDGGQGCSFTLYGDYESNRLHLASDANHGTAISFV